jgi:hypothetical protein
MVLNTTMSTSLSNHEPNESQEVVNPQMPQQFPLGPHRHGNEPSKKKEMENMSLRAGMPTWEMMRCDPHFKVGIIISSSSTNDRHIPSIAKPATPCVLSSVVVLHEQDNEDKEESMKNWFETHRMRSEVSNISVGWGKEGLKDLLESDVDAVYIIVPPG